MNSLTNEAQIILCTAEPEAKVQAIKKLSALWHSDASCKIGSSAKPPDPRYPKKLQLCPPREMPNRGRGNSTENRIALLHALCHIELNAMNLACDLLARFADPSLPRAFYNDWVLVAEQEAEHFDLLSTRLKTFGKNYGDLPAHDGLWDSARSTSHDLLARLAVVPLVLEARGLDISPLMINRMKKAKDFETAAILERIYDDEIGHVMIGRRWFNFLCEEKKLNSKETWQKLVKVYFTGRIQPPFNHNARRKAGFLEKEYEFSKK